MRFLKNKIAKAFLSKEKDLNKEPCSVVEEQNDKSTTAAILSPQKSKKRNRVSASPMTPETTRETKNIVQNYGRAICKFTTSCLALPYLEGFIQKEEGVTLRGFLEFVNASKGSVRGLYHFRSMLLPDESDDKVKIAYKKIFKQISEVFIKYFSVNWIFESKIKYKISHLKFRFKLLRRIKCPELFTYLVG